MLGTLPSQYLLLPSDVPSVRLGIESRIAYREQPSVQGAATRPLKLSRSSTAPRQPLISLIEYLAHLLNRQTRIPRLNRCQRVVDYPIVA